MNNFETLCERNSVDVKINFHHLKKFYNNVLKHFQKCIKNLCRNVFTIRVIAKSNRNFVCVYKMRHINLKNFRFHNESRNDFQTLRLR